MDFFGRTHPSRAPGFSQAADPFAGLAGGDEDEEINFDDTYDDLNDETFGGASLDTSAGSGKPTGTNVDFFGRATKASDVIVEEQARFSRQPTAVKTAPKTEPKRKPARTGYEVYQKPGYVEDLAVDPTLWGQAPTKSAQQETQPAAQIQESVPRKMMTLEEIEAQMGQHPQASQLLQQHVGQDPYQAHLQQLSQQQGQQQFDHRFHQQSVPPPASADGLQFHQLHQQHLHQQQQQQQAAAFANAQKMGLQGPQGHMSPQRQGGAAMSGAQQQQQQQQGGPIVTHPQQLMHMSNEDRAAALAEDAKRAKRNHKIWLLSKDNGLMTPQDKNFITRIQLQQLMAATGGMDDKDPDTTLSEDFYYQVITSIRGGPRHNPNQPLSHFAQTYLFQTGGRAGGHRRNGRADNHMQRMEQQVQRAVEAAKLKPKSKQLVMEGSLGKISFSNAKTPKPLLNIKKHESSDLTKRVAGSHLTGSDRKSILNNIEVVYDTLMKLEDEARKEPFLPPDVEPTDDFKEAHDEWSQAMNGLSSRLWDELKVLEAINQDSNIPHPFIAFLSYAKGKKAIPRIFRYLSSEQRVTMLTMIVIHLDILDVIRRGALAPGETQLSPDARESIELFSVTVTQSLFGYVSEASLFTIIGLLGLILDRVNVPHMARTRVGVSILTMITSRATIIKEAGEASDSDWAQWLDYYNKLFDVLEPLLAGVFPPSLNVDDVYVWQFLAAIGSGATPEQQQRLVIAVKDRVMETINQSRTLPPDMASQKRANVNLFMRAIGLDVDLLE